MAPKSRKQNSHRKQESKDIPWQQKRVAPVNGDRSTQEVIQSSLKALELLILAAVYSPVSQLTLSPVYGSVPSAIHHQRLTMVTFLLAWMLKNRIHTSVLLTMMGLLPVLATAIPTVQYFLFQLSGPLGPVYGPLITEVLTYSPLVFISVLGAAELFDAVDLSRYGEHVNHAGPGILSYAILSLAEKFSKSIIKQNIGSSLLFTRLGLQSVISTFYTILFPSKFLVLTILPLLHTFSANIHSPLRQNTSALNSSLNAYNYSLVARHESLTGYISVLDNFNDGFRVMRCDHSLLGGEWFKHPRAAVSALREPVYSVFVMLEAVRLVEVKSSNKQVAKPDKEKHALVM